MPYNLATDFSLLLLKHDFLKNEVWSEQSFSGSSLAHVHPRFPICYLPFLDVFDLFSVWGYMRNEQLL